MRSTPVTRLSIHLSSTYAKCDELRPKHAKLAQPAQTRPIRYDDDNNDYIFRANEIWQERYRILRRLGKGSFGQVFEAEDLVAMDPKQQRVAIKIIKNQKAFTAQALIEVRNLKLLNGKDRGGEYNIVRMLRHFMHRNHLCIVYELLGENLYETIKSDGFKGLSMNTIRSIAAQVLQCLKLMARPDVALIHCDLKPENILISHSDPPTIKVIDFGSSCFDYERSFSYIQSRFYRSPEVLLGNPYTTSIDMWSLGCILYELFSGEPLFSGKSEHDQLLRIMDLMPELLPRKLIDNGSSVKIAAFFKRESVPSKRDPTRLRASFKPVFTEGFERRKQTLESLLHLKFQRSIQLGRHNPRPASSKASAIQSTNPTLESYNNYVQDFNLFKDLLVRMLKYDPAERILPEEALQHRFFRTRMVDQESNTGSTMSSPVKRRQGSERSGASSSSSSRGVGLGSFGVGGLVRNK
ncbi:Dual specificity tyrosine-phosphorylation-regulated kinase 1A [Podochytrium sp. JEL0797]|nr:Dual specificity tyrosine-phosphorylation-regulated kinase 1A [Podochytrium sp. JEL0797]